MTNAKTKTWIRMGRVKQMSNIKNLIDAILNGETPEDVVVTEITERLPKGAKQKKLGRVGKFFLGKNSRLYTLKDKPKVDEAASERGVNAKGVMNQKQLHQLIINGKARGIMTQARNFLIAAGKLGCEESTKSLKHLDMALDILHDVCDD